MNCPQKDPFFLWHPKYWLTWFGIFWIFLLSLCPTWFRHALARGLGRLAYRYNHKRRQVIMANLAYCFPKFSLEKIEFLTRENLKYVAMGIVDISVLAFASTRRLKNLVEMDNVDYVDKINQDNGVLFLLLHSTFLDFVGVRVAKYQPSGSYKAFKNPVINWLILRLRCRSAQQLFERQDGLRGMLKILKNKGSFVYLPDEDFGLETSILVSFFAAQKATLTTTAKLVKGGKCVAMPMMVVWDAAIKKYRVKNLAVLSGYPSEDETQDALQLSQSFEKLIESDIAQYMWALKLFKTRPEGMASLY